MRQNEQSLRQEIVKVGRLLYEKGFICASDGNISARLGNGRFLITPSGLHKGFLSPEQLVIIAQNVQKLDCFNNATRHLKPTSELPMHLEAYRQRPDIQSVVHAHPPISVALSIAGIPMTHCLLPEVIVFLGLVPTTAYATPSSEENVRAIRELIGNHDALILQRHGSLAVGDSPMQGFMRTETIEQNARIGFMLAQLGVNNPLEPNEVQKLLAQRQKMGLMHVGEAEQFCTVCGVCHDGQNHAPTLTGRVKLGEVVSDTPKLDNADVQQMVAQVVQRTIGSY